MNTGNSAPAVRLLSWAFVLVAAALTVLVVRNAPMVQSSATEELSPACTVLCAHTSGSAEIGAVPGIAQTAGTGTVGQVG